MSNKRKFLTSKIETLNTVSEKKYDKKIRYEAYAEFFENYKAKSKSKL